MGMGEECTPGVGRGSDSTGLRNGQIGLRLRADVVVEGAVIVEVNALEVVPAIHTRQLQTYLRLGDYRVGLLLNFGAPR
jgi:GxxExxY protein